ncbi:SLIT and NTRK-like protein 2 isoform X2 [Mastacembelus armatus]|uniref:SLIT and NTRK-like protein 2 isoform X2 n=1 Tax=Mastacembelus armatus TaxID=205130 RepID=UPI000E4568BD|nr:SLIT and NTRK-like protein 2 isoform X2 [Mastacembelus armatus]
MLSGILLLSVLTVTSLSPSETESRKTSASKDICKSRCACEERENILNINCENKGFITVSQFQAPPNKISQLFLNGNFLSRLSANEFVNYGNVTSLHLGNNGLQEIRTGAFNGLRFLKRLHLNNNNLEVIKEDTFAGLESLEYLQADYNYISAIEPGAFSKLNKLKVLILNDNLLLSLPPNIFRFVLLTHLDLRGNRLKMLPFAGVLEHIGGIMEIQLEENPWNCTCDLIPLKSWLDTISVFVGDIVCETPFRLHGKDITQLIKQDLCPRRNAGERVHHPSDSHFQGALPPTYHPGMITPTRAPKASRPPKMRYRPTPRLTKDKHVFGPIMVYQTRSPVPMLCPSVCVCTSQNPDSGLNINCQERKLHNISELNPKPSYPKKLHLTVKGVLDQLSAFIQIDLQENPWDCTCDIVALKNWMELSSTSVVVNEITCDSPSKHAGRLLRSLRNEAICPEPSEVPPPQYAPPTKAPTLISPGTEATTISVSSSSSFSSVSPTESKLHTPELYPEVPLSVLILGLLVVFILSVCFGAGLFVFVLKRRKGVEHVPTGVNNLDLNSFQVQYGSYTPEPTQDKSSESHVYNYIPPPVGSMCQNPIYMQKDSEQVAYYRNLKELSFGSLDAKKDDVLTRSPGAYTISTVDFMDKSPTSCGLTTPEPPEMLYQNLGERPNKELPTAAGAPPFNYNFCTLPKRPCIVPPYEVVTARRHITNQDRLNKTVLYGTPRKYYGAEHPPKNNEHPLLLPGKLKTEPDYLEVLEKQTAMSQL